MSNKRKVRRGRMRRRPRRRVPWGLVALAGVLAAIAILVVVSATTGKKQSSTALGTQAKDFTLDSTAGQSVTLSSLRGHRTLLYFSEGVGCDGCWYQMAELEKQASAFSELDMRILPIVVNSAGDTRREMTRFGIKTPFLVDTDKTVSGEYDAIGSASSMHADLPGHTFVLVDRDGSIRWRGEYPQMYLDSDTLLGKLRAAIAGKGSNDVPEGDHQSHHSG